MILVDTSVWIDHLRTGDAGLVALLESNRVLMHPCVLGELACGTLRNRTEVLQRLSSLPRISAATDEEVRFFIGRRELHGRGIGFIDAHLLAALALAAPARLWSRDKRLQGVASSLGLAYADS